MPKFDKLPAYFEELTIKEEVAFTLADLITQLKQQIPANFVYLEIKEKNYQCSTTGWKEPVCERYGFTYENKWIQLDIPHSLLEKLGLKQKKDLPSSFFLAPHLLKKEVETTQGGITLKEGEIILVNPHKLLMKDQQIQTDLTLEKIKDLEKAVAEQTRQIQKKDKELTSLKSEKQTLETELNKTRQGLANANSQLSSWTNTFLGENASQVQTRINNIVNSLNSQITQKNAQINTLQTNYNNANNRANNLQTQLNTANTELQKEKGWWDKWFKGSVNFVSPINGWGQNDPKSGVMLYGLYLDTKRQTYRYRDNYDFVQMSWDMKQFFKENIYQYYRDK